MDFASWFICWLKPTEVLLTTLGCEVFSCEDFTMLVNLLRGIELLAGVTTLLMLEFSLPSAFYALATTPPVVVFFDVV